MKHLTYYPDVDSQNGVKLKSSRVKVDYLRGRTIKICISPLKEVLLVRKNNEAIWDLNIGVCTLICEGISALSTYYRCGGRGDRFKYFVEDFLYPREPVKRKYSKLLWQQVRCSLTHGFYVQGASIVTDASQHFVKAPGGKVQIDLESFFSDFESGTKRFFMKLKSGRPRSVVTTFEKRFDEVFPDLV